MARAKMIKEVEVKFSPAFEKAINGVKTTKKVKAKTKAAVKTKTKKRKATVKTKTPKATGPKVPRGYNIEKIEREMNIEGKKAMYELYVLTGKKMPEAKTFVGFDYALKYIGTIENEILQTKALAGKVHGGPMARAIIVEQRELAAAADLPELDTERPEKCDKTYIEDIDA